MSPKNYSSNNYEFQDITRNNANIVVILVFLFLQQNAFNTTTVSSNQYYNSQVSATTQPSQYTSYTYTQSTAGSTPQPAGTYGTETNAASNTAVSSAATSSTGDMHAKLSGPRKYPSASYQQTGMQQYYAPTPTSSATSQPGYPQQPVTGMYNPTNYAPTSQPQPNVGTYQPQQPQQPVSTYQPTPPPPINTSTTAQKPKVEGAWNDPPILKPKKVGIWNHC